MPQAPRAGLEVSPQPLAGFRGAFTVKQGPHLGDHFRATHAAVGIVVVRVRIGRTAIFAHWCTILVSVISDGLPM
ncbi:Uncharacterised protein [Mycobacterium tuberculosis]|nr:Uncharacterised protein [Mycobacterium tuberculosis]